MILHSAPTVTRFYLVTNTINEQQVVATESPIGIGMNTSVYYNNMNAPYISSALDAGGVSIVRYPGGNYSDIYHWTDNIATGGYTNSNSNFGVWATNIINSPNGLAKQAMVTIDYGSSLNNTMGGQPQEAAAWVAYANGTVNGANATMQLGTDAEGNNWGTVRYWAALRAASPSDANWATDGSVGVVLNASDKPSMTPGNFDTFISASASSNTSGIVYAAKRAHGTISIMLINPNSSSSNMAVSISGDNIQTAGTLFSTSLTSDPTQSLVTGLGNSFTATVAARSISVYELSPLVVPEPATAILFGMGMVALGLFRMPRGSGGA